jgi:hypothetical protein
MNVRLSLNIGVSDGRYNSGSAISCQIIVDDIYDSDGELLFNVERHIGMSSDYYTSEIFNYRLGYWV